MNQKGKKEEILLRLFFIIIILFGTGAALYDYYQKNWSPNALKDKELDERFARVITKIHIDSGYNATFDSIALWRYVNLSDCTFLYRDCWIDSLEYGQDMERRAYLLKLKGELYFNSDLWKARKP